MSDNRYDKDRELFNSLFKDRTLNNYISEYNHTTKKIKEKKKHIEINGNKLEQLTEIDKNRIILKKYIDQITYTNDGEKSQIDSVEKYLTSRINTELEFYKQRVRVLENDLKNLLDTQKKLLTKLEKVKQNIEIQDDNEKANNSDNTFSE